MKRFVIVFCLVFTLIFGGCYNRLENSEILPPVVDLPENNEGEEDLVGGSNDEETGTDNEVVIKPILPQPPIEDEEIIPDDSMDEEQSDKKKYAVSKVNSLRVRSKPNSVSTVLGYLDKNDAIYITESVGEYYKTVFKEKEAYVYSSYCEIMEIDYADEKIERAIDLGSTLLGHPYVWGSQRYHWGNGKLNSQFVAGEFDCSALVQYVYYISNGVILDVTTRTQVDNGVHVDKKDLTRGDLMFFTNESRKNKSGNERIGHVAIYFGNNYILHTASDHAVIEPISSLRWSYYITARRVV